MQSVSVFVFLSDAAVSNNLLHSKKWFKYFISTISFPAGQNDNTCNVFPKDQYIEVGSSAKIFCQTSCVKGKVFWTLNNVVKIDESLSNTINSTHTVLLLRNFTYPSATLQCHSAHKRQVLGGTIIRTYCKKWFHYILFINMAFDSCSEGINMSLILFVFSKAQKYIMPLSLQKSRGCCFPGFLHVQMGASDQSFNENKLQSTCKTVSVIPS